MTDQNPGRRIALVAGATGAIGAAVVELLVQQGWAVVATHRSTSLTAPANDLVHCIRFDGTADEDVAHLHKSLSGISGTLSAVVSAIGVPSSKRPVADTPATEYSEVFEGNVTSVVRLWHAVHKRARAGKAGVVLLGSDTTATLRPGNGAYSAAKAGLEALAATLATEESAHGVRVNVVAPSLVDSPLAERVLAAKGVTKPEDYYLELPWGRALSTEEVARVAIDVATGVQWQYVSGQTVRLAARTGS
jgi:NAD(P)-dependent dehydrogenase (short-subunit alcohol dehydrogenase family)